MAGKLSNIFTQLESFCCKNYIVQQAFNVESTLTFECFVSSRKRPFVIALAGWATFFFLLSVA